MCIALIFYQSVNGYNDEVIPKRVIKFGIDLFYLLSSINGHFINPIKLAIRWELCGFDIWASDCSLNLTHDPLGIRL